MTPAQTVAQIVEILTSGLTSYAQSIGGAISSAVQSMFFTGTGETQQLSIYAVMVLVFGGIALAVGLTRLIFNWLGSLGGSN